MELINRSDVLRIINTEAGEWNPNSDVSKLLSRIAHKIGNLEYLTETTPPAPGANADLSVPGPVPGSDVRPAIWQDGSGDNRAAAGRVGKAWSILVGRD